MNNNHQQNGAKGPPIFTLIVACALMVNTSSLAHREVGDLGGVARSSSRTAARRRFRAT
jgi:hypothetical protein